MQKGRVAIIGAGIGGLATAIQLAAHGYDVEVYEKNSTPGGKVGEIRDQGYRFDTGPSLFTLPGLLNELWDHAGTPQGNRLLCLPLSSVCRYVFADGSTLEVPSDPHLFALEAQSALGEPSGNIGRYLNRAANLYNLTSGIFLFSPFQKLKSLLKRENLPVARRLHTLRAFTTLHRFNRKSFATSHMIQLFDRYATYNGSSPFNAPATLHMIAHLEHNLGAWFPKGGMRCIAEKMEQEAKRLGVLFHFDTPAFEICIQKRKVTGVRSKLGERYYDHVVSNADVYHTYAHLLPGLRLPKSIAKQELSTSAVIFYWGVRGVHEKCALHNILFSSDYRKEFEHLFRYKTISDDPTVYIYISSRMAKEDAPEGAENWFVMVNAPAREGIYDEGCITVLRKVILGKIRSKMQIDIEPLIEMERVNTPVTHAGQTNSFMGALYGPSSNSKWSAFLRHPNFSRKIRNLWFAGGTVHPGGGIPLCLASAKIVSGLIMEKDQKNRS